MANGEFYLETMSRTASNIRYRWVLRADSSADPLYYRVRMYFHNNSDYNTWFFRRVTDNESLIYPGDWAYAGDSYEAPLNSNTSYRFYGQLYYSTQYTGVQYTPGSATYDTTVMTYPVAPTGLSASVNGSTLSVSWSQDTGGNASTVKNVVHIYNPNGGLVAQSSASTSRSYSTSISGWSAGTYTVEVFTSNDASEYDAATISNTTTFTITSGTPSGSITNVDISTSTTSADFSFRYTNAEIGTYRFVIWFDEGTITSSSRSTADTSATHFSIPQTGSSTVLSATLLYLDAGITYNYRIDVIKIDSGSETIVAQNIGTFNTDSGGGSSGIDYSLTCSAQQSGTDGVSFSFSITSNDSYLYLVDVYDGGGNLVYAKATSGSHTLTGYSSGDTETLYFRVWSTNSSVAASGWSPVTAGGHTYYYSGEYQQRSVTITGGGGGEQWPTQATISNVTVEAHKTSVVVQWDLILPEASLRGYTGEVTIGPSRNTPQGIAEGTDGSYQGSSGIIHFSVPFSGLSLRTGVHYGFKIIMWTGVYGGSQSTWGEMGLEYVGDFVITSLLLEWSWETASGSWNAENQSGHSSLAIAARNALQNKTATTNFSHLIWNDIIDWLTDNLDSLGTSYSSSTASSAKMTTQPYYLTAAKWNSMVSLWNTLGNAIESGNSYTMQNQSAGNPVNAALFIGANGFIDIMNSSINNYNT